MRSFVRRAFLVGTHAAAFFSGGAATAWEGASFAVGLAAAPGFSAATVLPGWRMPASLVRFNISALIATIRVLPDMEIAATSGLNTNGYSTPAASGKAIVL